MLPQLPPRPVLVALPAGVHSVGFAVDDYAAVVQAVSGLSFAGTPDRAVLKRRAEFLAGRLAALHALHALGIAEQPGRLPDGSPSWPSSTVGSISHGAGRALCAVAKCADFRSLGIDAERLLKPAAKEELRRRICADSERGVLRAALKLPEHHQLSLAFSVKESLFKCLYPMVGKFMDFQAARVVAVVSRAQADRVYGELTLELCTDWSAVFVAGRAFKAQFAFGPDHVETVVALAA